ncbi:PorP/SprF family type IX secretion system membrane protein [Neolewinella lacunae]|uniref:PorP/SprF family type IX secretion system membrane protein n=1 Tax=Neolewinella lacunae TaxID=1517758 RepID=A0A923T7I7_9BACT|nr:PorP/SprF family type IX secretion system membrane protein [Neolewinella lacunae]MBC6993624.1 PorP/SprF family type IX secretion system membrane protein [Neolewinella lacunae]MDN3635530.1 PorP/SprF family type IX secretion system membrane protein [Neolewinella lacunae]
MPRRSLFTLLLLALAVPAAAQDAVFSQFYAAPLRLNPALVGIGSAPRLSLNYRAQHTAYPSAFTTMAAAYEQPIEGTNSSFGVRLLSDRQLEGVYQNTEAAIVYGYDVQFNRDLHARIGLAAGILSTALDFQRLTFGDVLDPVVGANGATMEALASASKTSADLGVGVVLYGKQYYGGVSFEHLNRPDESLIELNDNLYAGRPQRMTITGGAQFDVKRYSNPRRPSYITPNFLYTSQAQFRQLNLGTYFGYGPLAIGGWYRHAFGNADGFIAAVAFRQDVLKVGFSYDAVVSQLRTVPGGLGATFEVSLTIDMAGSRELQRKRNADRYNDCFGMFR